MSIRSSWSIESFKVCVSLLIFCLVDLSIVVSGVLKSPTLIVLLLISSFIFVSICLTYCGAPMVGANIFIIVLSSSWIDPLMEGFLISPGYSLELCIQMGISFLFSFVFHFSFLSYLEGLLRQPFCLSGFLFLGDGFDHCLLYKVTNLRP